ncbi:MAG: single-stranded-DNA-specific exonuclease RecJ [Candidatus Puniceispirillum sp. TMED52]|nr:single-stranded-DNA-specific exonuclease RecJ [SAR116 cluster bacterium]OUU44859.1 MAG: single-stranded-DNA-specific exonuclease RecJ [Candidatus Puniceispirillum sp. TMED52]
MTNPVNSNQLPALSATGAHWVSAEPPPHITAGIMEASGMPHPLAHLLAARGITKTELGHWLDPKIRDLMPDPSQLTDMDAAASRLADAVMQGEHGGIFGDYDVDGASSTAILYRCLDHLGLPVSYHIPHRFTEGYGPNLPALLGLKDKGCQLIVTVDCGVTAHAPVAATVEAGVDVIIIDHHLPGTELPPALAVVNPNRLDDDSGLGYMAAAGVVFMLVVALVRELRQRDWFTANDKQEPDLMAAIDLVALATVADVVPLAGLNRAFVRAGLKIMAKRGRVGLRVLADIGRLTAPPDTEALGFVLGPRINAAGRFGETDLGVSLLTTDDPQQALELATMLDQLNTKRQSVERDTTAAAMAQAEGKTDAVICVAGGNWHEGVIGISAGRVKEAMNKPACVISISEDEDGRKIGKGSGRSVVGMRLGAAIIAAKQNGYLLSGGGHDMAAGFSLDMAHFDAFCQFLNQRAETDLADKPPYQEWHVDVDVPLSLANETLLDWLDRIGPFGSGFPQPMFQARDVRAASWRRIGKTQDHVALRLDDGLGQIDAVAFRVAGTPLGEALSAMQDGRKANIIGRITRNRFRGEDRPQMIITDLQFV